MLGAKQLTVPIDFHSMENILWKSMATGKFLVTSTLQTILFSVQQV